MERVTFGKKLLEFCLFILTALSASGLACIFLSTGHARNGLLNTSSTLRDAVDDVFLFVNNTVVGVWNITEVIFTEFNTTQNSVISDLQDVGTQVSSPLMTMLREEGGLNNILSAITGLQNSAGDIKTKLILMDGILGNMINFTEVLKTEVVGAQTLFQEAIDSCWSTQCTDALNAFKPAMDAFGSSISSIDSSQFRPAVLNSTAQTIDQVLQTNFSAVIIQQFDIIPEMVNNVSGGYLQPIRDAIRDVNLSREITPVMEKLRESMQMVYSIRELFEVDYYIGVLTRSEQDFANIILMSTLSFLSAPVMILLTQCTGLWMGICCGSQKTHPTERGCGSVTGGRCLMITVALIFLLSWIMMLLTTLLFTISAPVARVLCEDDFETMIMFEKVFADQGWFSIESMLPSSVQLNLTVTRVMQRCDVDYSMLDAFGLREFISGFINAYKSHIDIEGQLQALIQNMNLSDFDQLSTIMNSSLSGVVSVIDNFDINNISSQLGAVDSLFDGSNPGVNDMADQLVNISLQMPGAESLAAGKLNDTADQLRGPVNNAMLAINSTKNEVMNVLTLIGGDIVNISGLVNNTKDAVLGLQQYIATNGLDVILRAAMIAVNSLLGRIDTFIHVVFEQAHLVLRCKPVMDVYRAVIDKTLCEFIINPLNGFWFCLGAVVFSSVLTVIVAVRLSKYYRRMEPVEGNQVIYDPRSFKQDGVKKASSHVQSTQIRRVNVVPAPKSAQYRSPMVS
ncbi:prominin-1-like [Liolophura sinensis]|uniref:prominin-1-like n=1 Tax=Liolophura sinensis TaxID=3198878 RepID=UPI00315919C0